MTAPVTMRQIAERAQVSIGTVSNVINETAIVRPKLRERVIEAIRSMGYQPSALAQGLRKNRTNMLGMVIPDITNPFFPGVVRGVEDVAYKRSFRVILCNADNDPSKEASYVRELRSYHIAGLLIIPAAGADIAGHLRAYASASVPVVCIDRVPDGWKGDAVLVANAEGAYLATRHLIQMGHNTFGRDHWAAQVDQRGRAIERFYARVKRSPNRNWAGICAGSALRYREWLPGSSSASSDATAPDCYFCMQRPHGFWCTAGCSGTWPAMSRRLVHCRF